MFTWLFIRRPDSTRRHLDLQTMDVGLSQEISRVLANAGVPTFRQALPRMAAELDRARRYQRPFTLVVFAAADEGLRPDHPMRAAAPRGNSLGPTQLPPGSAYVAAIVACVLRELLREVDIVTYSATLGRCIVLMPEVTAAEARLAVARVADVCARRLTFAVCGGYAVFPEHGWTLEDLTARARQHEGPFDTTALTALDEAKRAFV